MVVLVTCKNEEDPIKNEGARVVKTLAINKMLKGSSIIVDGSLTKFKLIQAFIVVLPIYKNEDDPCKVESTSAVTTLLPL